MVKTVAKAPFHIPFRVATHELEFRELLTAYCDAIRWQREQEAERLMHQATQLEAMAVINHVAADRAADMVAPLREQARLLLMPEARPEVELTQAQRKFRAGMRGNLTDA